uniref:ER membrane protein complex subunit 10 n=2 Tax=Ditylum brightwellii TaxID=49249 RepID=A0A6U3X7U5_9STRA|mmetsp:Transcript_30524/g.45468  ORF Transcript_30524/g.45468 Transcript_30524/m.45468 type:complete len:308 (+) Transcript_30524:117-1040(+)
MRISPSLILPLISTLVAASSATAEAVTRRYKLYHNLGGTSTQPFVERGTILLSNDASLVSEEEKTAPSADKAVTLTAQVEKSGEEEESCKIDAQNVNDLIEKGGMYTLKVVDEESGSEAMASVNGCSVRRANFREEITLTIGHTGTLLSVSYTPLVSLLAKACSPLDTTTTSDLKFQTTVSYQTSTPGMSLPLVLPSGMKPPPGLSFFPQSKKVGVAGAGGAGATGPSPFAEAEEKQQHKSFLMKYWYIVLPLFIMGLTSGAEEEPPQGGGGGGASAGAGGAAPAVAAGGAPAGGGGQSARRRGKRG